MEGGRKKKLINPVGREVNSGAEASYQTRACMCSSGMYATAKGDDSCFHCGCNCSSLKYDSNNDSNAFWTVRSSSEGSNLIF